MSNSEWNINIKDEFAKEWIVNVSSSKQLEKSPNSSKTRLLEALKFYSQGPLLFFTIPWFIAVICTFFMMIWSVYSTTTCTSPCNGFENVLKIVSALSSLLIGAVAAVIAKYWHFYNQYGSKWQFAAKQYYDLKTKEKLSHSERFRLEQDLCVDILSMGIWADPCLARFFFTTLHRSIEARNIRDAEDFLTSYGIIKTTASDLVKDDSILALVGILDLYQPGSYMSKTDCDNVRSLAKNISDYVEAFHNNKSKTMMASQQKIQNYLNIIIKTIVKIEESISNCDFSCESCESIVLNFIKKISHELRKMEANRSEIQQQFSKAEIYGYLQRPYFLSNDTSEESNGNEHYGSKSG